jgi:phage terminase small subunit
VVLVRVIICAISDDLPEPRPPLQTILSMSELRVALHTEWFTDKQQIEVTEMPVFVDDIGDDDG